MKLRRSSLWVTGLLLAAGAALYAQQQAAEAPATDRRAQTRPAVAGLHGLVTSGHPIASSAGLQMLLKGGNAFDAAVAVGVMAPLGEPEMNGIGGNGFATLYVKVLPGWGSIGHMQAIRVDPKTGTMMAGGDPRRTAYAMGY